MVEGLIKSSYGVINVAPLCMSEPPGQMAGVSVRPPPKTNPACVEAHKCSRKGLRAVYKRFREGASCGTGKTGVAWGRRGVISAVAVYTESIPIFLAQHTP